MASIADTEGSEGFGSRRRHAIVIQRARKVSVPKAKRKDAGNKRQTGRSAGAVLDLAEAKALVALLSKYVVRLLLDSNRRRALREKCTARLQVQNRCGFLEFAEQAVLANLFWGVEGVEKAIRCRTREAKSRRLESAEQMLQVPALLDEHGTTAGVRNSRIIACAYLNLALVWKLRRNDWQMALHLLQAFLASPRYLRLELAPDLWERLFRSHANQPAGAFEKPLEPQAENGNTENLEILYENALDKITGQRAKHYKDWLIYYSVVVGEEVHDVEKPRADLASASSEDDVHGSQAGGAGFEAQLTKGLHGATFGTGCSLKPPEQEIHLQHMNANDTSMGIHVGKDSAPETLPKARILGHEVRVNSFHATVMHSKNQHGVKISPLLQMDNKKSSIRKSAMFRHLKSKKAADTKCLADILREPQSDMNMSADSCTGSTDEDSDLEEITDYLFKKYDGERPKVKAAACVTATDILTTVPRERKSQVVNILQQIQRAGVFNSMHILMAYIQQVPLEHKPLPAGLLLKLDILAESQRQSIFREEAVDVLLAALTCEESINAQISSASVLANLGGHFTCTGEPTMVSWLVKKAGLSIAHHKHITDGLGSFDGGLKEEDNDTDCWSSKIAKNVMLCGSHVFEALKRGLQSKVSQVARDSLVAVAWLGCEITEVRRNCLRAVASDIILPEIIDFIQPGRELEERVIASLSLYNYTAGAGFKQLMKFSNELHGSLRRLAAFTWTAEKLLKIIAHSSPFEANIAWDHSQVIEISDIASEKTLALLHYNGTLYSGYSDGSIKVWDVKKMSSQLVQKVRLHRKSVTCFALCKAGNSLLSGSADKTVRIWNVIEKKLECMKVLELKEPVHRLDIYGQMLLIVTRSSGVKVHHGNGIVKVLNESKHVQSLIVAEDKIYCGCKDSSIQEVTVASSQAKEIQGCTRTWLGKRPIYAIVPFRDWLYTAGALDDGFSLKVWRRQEGTLLAMISTGSDVQAMAVTEDFVCLNCSATPNILQIWLREKLEKVASLTLSSRVTSLLAANDIIFCGTEKGTIKAWVPP